MAAVLELEAHPATADRAASVHLMIDDREYLLVALSQGVVIYPGRWIRSRRALGKPCWSLEDVRTRYRRDGHTLAEYAARLGVREVAA